MNSLSSLLIQQKGIAQSIDKNLANQVVIQHLETKYGKDISSIEEPYLLKGQPTHINWTIFFNKPNKYSGEGNGNTGVNIPINILDSCDIEKIILCIDKEIENFLPENT